MFVVIYSVTDAKVLLIMQITMSPEVDLWKVTCKSAKWKSTNFKLRKLPQHHSLRTVCILKLFFIQLAVANRKKQIYNCIEKDLYAQLWVLLDFGLVILCKNWFTVGCCWFPACGL